MSFMTQVGQIQAQRTAIVWVVEVAAGETRIQNYSSCITSASYIRRETLLPNLDFRDWRMMIDDFSF